VPLTYGALTARSGERNEHDEGNDMGRVEGQVALITGAARGQGRAHALRLAQEGADIIAVDALTDFATMGYEMATEEDLAETARLVKETGRDIIAERVDVRDRPGLQAVVDRGLEQFGKIDILVANAGISPPGTVLWEVSEAEWDDVMNVNLKGVWNTTSVVIPSMIERGEGGKIVITASAAGLMASPHIGDYSASKHGVVGLGRTLAKELAKYRIRVNMLAPAAVGTPMMLNATLAKLFCPDIENPTIEDLRERSARTNPMGVAWLDAVDIANAALWLVSDEARYVTGIVVPLDAGALG
jgi:SDR family mycofactocin-dependent oxidoreductase